MKAALFIMAIVFIFTAASFILSMYFTRQNMTEAMEHELRLALDIADSLVSTKIELLKSNATNISDHLLRVDSDKDMEKAMSFLLPEYTEFLSLTVLNQNGIIANYGQSVCSKEVYDSSIHFKKALTGEIDISSTHYDEGRKHFVIHLFVPMNQELVLSATIPAMMLSNLISDFKLWNTGNIFIVDNESTVIANVRTDLVHERYNFIEKARNNPDVRVRDTGVFFRSVINTSTGSGRYYYNDQERLCVYKRVSSANAGWHIGVVAPIHESPLQNVQNGLLLASLIFLSIGAVVSILVSGIAIEPFKKIQSQNETLEALNDAIQAQTDRINEEHERARILLNATPLACRLMKRVGDKKYELFDCNEQSVKLFKFKDKKEFMDRYFEIYPEYQPDGKSSLEEGQRFLEKAFIEGRHVLEFVFQATDGELIPAEVTLVRLEYGNDFIIAGYTRDMREHNRMMETIEKRSILLQTGNTAVQVLLSTEDDIENALLESLAIVGRAVGADRVHIWRNEMINGVLHFMHIYDWLSEAGKQKTAVPIGLRFPYAALPRWEGLFSSGEYLSGLIKDMPEEENRLLGAYDIKSIVIMPLFIKNIFWGFFSICDCVGERIFSEEEIHILISVSRMLCNAINRNLQSAKIREAHHRTRLLLDTAPLAVNLWDRNINLFDCNEESVRLFKMKDKQDYLDRFRELSPEYQPDGSRSVEAVDLSIKRAFKEGELVFEWVHQTSDGIPIPSEITLVRVAYDDDFAVAGYIRDLREQKEMMNEISQKSNLLDSINKAANMLLQSESDEFENNLQLSMGMIGKAVNADRVCIWKNSVKDGKLHCSLVNEWIANEAMRTSSEISTDVPYEGNIPTFERILTKGKYINSLIRDLSPIEQSRMNMHGIKSIFVAPVFVHDEFWGFVGCDNCRNETVFSEEVATTLRSGSLLIANALLHNEMTLSLQRTATELKTALLDTQRANNAKSDFLASMSHEMRTPLNAVIGLSELVLEDGGINKTAEVNLGKIYSAGETLLSLVNDILDISKIEAGKFELIEGEYDTPSLINDTITNNLLRIGEKPIEFILDIKEDLPAQLYGDELRIKQVLSNLLSNAFKYTREGTVELGIDCLREGDVVWFSAWIRDTGIGIRPEDIERLFSNYTQMDTKTNRKIEGTGLGLPIAKKMAELMDGVITVKSEYGKGSTFAVRIRQKYVNDATIGHEVAKSLKSFRYSDHKRSKNAKIARIRLPYARVLVVDDNVTNLDVAKGLMKPYGMQIDTASSGQQAIDAMSMKNIKYNAIFMDHMMPGMDGIEATKRIREIGTDYAKNIPIIALTANAIAGNEKMFLSKGFQGFLSKPVDISRLDTVIRHWVRDKTMEHEYVAPAPVSNNESSILKFKIDGVDLEAGIERFGEDDDTYLQILRSYTASVRTLLDSIKDVNKENLHDYTITVHGIKGSSYNICANHVGDIAEDLEKAAKEGNLEYVREKTPDLTQNVVKLLADLNGMLAKISGQAHKPTKSKPDKEVLVKILEACYTFNMETVEAAVKELESYEYETNGELVHWLWENVQQFNIDEIIKKLSEMNLDKDYS